MDALPCGLHIGDPRRTTFKEWSSNCNLCVEHWNIPLSRSWRESQRWEIFFLRRNIPMDGQFWCRESGQVEDLKHFLSSQRTLFRRGIFFLPVMKGKKLFWKRKFCYFSFLRCHDLERIQATPADPVDHCLAGGRTRVPSGELPDFEVVLILCKGGSGARRASWPRGAFVAGRSRRGRKGEKLVSSTCLLLLNMKHRQERQEQQDRREREQRTERRTNNEQRQKNLPNNNNGSNGAAPSPPRSSAQPPASSRPPLEAQISAPAGGWQPLENIHFLFYGLTNLMPKNPNIWYIVPMIQYKQCRQHLQNRSIKYQRGFAPGIPRYWPRCEFLGQVRIPGLEQVLRGFPPGIPTSASAVATSGRAPVARSSSLGPG